MKITLLRRPTMRLRFDERTCRRACSVAGRRHDVRGAGEVCIERLRALVGGGSLWPSGEATCFQASRTFRMSRMDCCNSGTDASREPRTHWA